MNESFVFHSDFYLSLPEALQVEWAMYAVRYGIEGTEPTFKDPIYAENWRKIKDRIDADKTSYESEKLKRAIRNAKSHLTTGRATPEEIKLLNDNGITLDNLDKSGLIQNNPPYTRGVSVSDSVSVSEFESVSEYEYESVSDAPEHPGNNALSPILSNKEYPKVVYKLWKDAGLPCGDFTQWTMRDFKTALEYIHKNRYSSQEVIAACENYIKELNDPDSYITNQMPFASFVKSKIFYNVLPTNYRHDNFAKFVTKPEEKPYTGEMLKGVMYG